MLLLFRTLLRKARTRALKAPSHITCLRVPALACAKRAQVLSKTPQTLRVFAFPRSPAQSAHPRANTLSRTARLSPWAFIPWAPQHVRVFSRTNTLSRITRYSPLGLYSFRPHSTSACFCALIRFSVLRFLRPGLSSLGRHSTSACFRAQIRFRVMRAIALGSNPLGPTARPRASAH